MREGMTVVVHTAYDNVAKKYRFEITTIFQRIASQLHSIHWKGAHRSHAEK